MVGWDNELLPILDFSILKDNICSTVTGIRGREYECYELENNLKVL